MTGLFSELAAEELAFWVTMGVGLLLLVVMIWRGKPMPTIDKPVHVAEAVDARLHSFVASRLGSRSDAEAAGQECSLEGEASSEETTMTVWIYTDTSKQVGEVERLKVFASQDDAEQWLKQHDREEVAFEYPVKKTAD
jgi:hypothetical protein